MGNKSLHKKAVTAEQKNALKQMITRTAIGLFLADGYDNVKISDIARAAGISTGGFYSYFPSKEAVLSEYAFVSDEYFREIIPVLRYDSYSDLLRQLVQHKFRLMVREGSERVTIISKAIIGNLNHHDEGAFALDCLEYELYEKALADGIASGEFRKNLDPHALCSQLRYIVGGITVHWCMTGGAFDIFQAANQELDLFLSMIVA